MSQDNKTTYQPLQPQYRLLVLLVSIGFFMQALDTTIVNTALPAMAHSLQQNPLKMHGVIVAYVLSVASFIPLSGWLADRFGLRHVYLFAICLFSLASLGCGMATSFGTLIFFRILQGIGGALLLPVGRLSLLKIIPRPQFLAAMSLMSLAGLIGPLIGPTLGGWLVEQYSWHWIFLINLPMGLLGIVVTLKALPNIKTTVQPFDSFGFLLLILAMVGLTLGIDSFSEQQSHFLTALLIGMGMIGCFGYAAYAHFSKKALFRSDLFRNAGFRIGILGNFFARFSGNSIPFLLPLMLQVAFLFEPLTTGLMLIPLVLGSLASKPIVRPLIQQLGYRRVLVFNTAFSGLCTMAFALHDANMPEWIRASHFFICGIFNSTQFVSMNTFTLKDLPKQYASSGNSFLSMIMMLSMSIAIAIAGALINIYSLPTLHLDTVRVFHWTFISLGFFNIFTLIIFLKIPKGQ
ncbi:multidrug transporter subunit MdtD [Acinetobacter sp. MD2(2019)]|uniref:multidrug transporter subunit MdtD n=1 Tax=Acinetobacter sp. MD2(2019) TaxID=2605273 RepID=UPI002D1F0A2A|nr:multidrug transporter subunit MdtD [Acinetobacter sp. MD2(2019)]MEB3754999.1 multidrug transporter subunit MdtD [Acinetobacter sp. MD2(2019)]